MQSVDKYSNVLDDNKEAVVTTPLLENKLLTTEKVITSHEVHKHTENIKAIEDVDKDTDEAQKRTQNITTIEYVDKDTEKFEYMKNSVVTILRKDSDKFEGQYKVSTVWFNIDHD